ncbi:ankyrin-3-like [Chrysoperla carnea]|uniref:ankyrin-3-like n=1 Tax=Chrysoperla carnea TaxID=189513 RepID=UPI001D06EB4F|nr:ankyrin-3-like [Chrysoperla carnea]
MVKDLINRGISVDAMIFSELHLKEGDQPGKLIQLAVKKDNAEIIRDLIINGVNDGITSFGIINLTPLCLAVYLGQEEIAEILIAHGANVNVVNIMGAPLHIAAANGYVNIVGNLLRNGADISIRDTDNSTPLELAVTNGHLQVVKIILQHKKVNMNAKCIDGWTILHYASQENNLAMVKFLVDEGCNINLETDGGLKPIHIAAREGNKDIVEFFVSKGLCINEPDKQNLTILHYAVTTGQLEVIKYLIEKGADVNAKNDKGVTPMHLAALCSCKKDVIEILLNNYAIYNAIDEHFMRPIDMASNNDVIHSLTLTKKLFESVKCNNISEVENNIRAGACVNAKNADNITTLHYAAWKGYDKIVQILLQNKANPNAVGKNGYTPIHYAAKFSHLQVVNALLSYGAVYDALSDSGKTPLDFSEGSEVTSLLKLINESFQTVKEGDVGIIDELNKIKDIDVVKIVMRACNRENKTLSDVACDVNFQKSNN